MPAFWGQVAEGYAVRPYDAKEIAELAARGLTPETDPTVMVDGSGPTFCFHLRTGPRPERNRVHVDFATENREGEVARLVALGATLYRQEPTYTTLKDPEGNQFCIIDAD